MTVLLSMIVLLAVVGAMSIGVIMGRKPIKGTCGGLSAIGLKGDCEICGGNLEKCENKNNENLQNSIDADVKTDLAVDASKK